MASTTEPRRSGERRPSRRTLLAHAALVAPASLLPAIAAAAAGPEPDPFPALEREFFRFYRWEDLPRPVDDDDPRIPVYAEGWQRTARAIVATPATTPAGLRAKVRVLTLELTDGQSAYGEDLARSLLADLERLAGEATRV
jgi:hypothetical protein